MYLNNNAGGHYRRQSRDLAVKASITHTYSAAKVAMADGRGSRPRKHWFLMSRGLSGQSANVRLKRNSRGGR